MSQYHAREKKELTVDGNAETVSHNGLVYSTIGGPRGNELHLSYHIHARYQLGDVSVNFSIFGRARDVLSLDEGFDPLLDHHGRREKPRLQLEK